MRVSAFTGQLSCIADDVTCDGAALTTLEVLASPRVTAFERCIFVSRCPFGLSGQIVVIFKLFWSFAVSSSTTAATAAAKANAAADSEGDTAENHTDDHTSSSSGSALGLSAAETVDSAAVGASSVVAIAGTGAVVTTTVAVD